MAAGGSFDIVDGALHERDVPDVLARKPCGQHLQHFRLQVVRIDASVWANTRAETNGEIAGTRADIGDRQARQRAERVERLVGRLFEFPLRSLEPFGALPSHDVCEAPAGDGMNARCSDALGKDGCRREERGQCQSLEVLH